MNMLEVGMKPNLLTRYHKCPCVGNNQIPMLMEDMLKLGTL